MLVARRLAAFPRPATRAAFSRQPVARCSPYRQTWAAQNTRSIYASAYRRAEVVDAPPKTSPKAKRVKKADGEKPAKAKAAKKAAPKTATKPKPKAKAKAAAKPPAKKISRVHLPKQVTSIWQLFLTRQIDARKAELPSGEKLSVTKLATEIAGDYRALSSDKRAALESDLENVKAEYKKDYAAALAALTPEQIIAENRVRASKRKSGTSHKHNLRDPNKPKTPPTAYLLFYQDRLNNTSWSEETLAKLSQEDRAISTKKLPHMSKTAAAEWRSLSADDKSRFEQRANEARKAYQTALAKYKESTAA